MFVLLDMHPVNRSEVIVASASEKIDDKGRVTDGKTREKIKELLGGLVAWTNWLGK